MKRILFIMIILSLFTSVFSLQADEDLQLYLPLTENANDYSGNSRTITVSGTPIYNSSGAYFDGSNDNINVSFFDEMDNQQITFAGYFNIHSYHLGTTTHLLSRYPDTPSSDRQDLFYCTNTGKYQYYTQNGQQVSGTTNCVDNDVKHIVGTYNGTHARIYIDGVLETTSAITRNNASMNDLFLGSRYDQSVYYENTIKEFSVWSRVLSDSEVTDLYNNGVELSPFTTDVEEFYNSENISIEVNTSQIGNISYVLNTESVDAGVYLDGTDDFIEIGNVGYVDEINFTLDVDDTTGFKTIFRLTGSTYLRLNNNVVQAPNMVNFRYWVDGVENATVTAGTKHNIYATFDAINGADARIGALSAHYFKGNIYDSQFLYNDTLVLHYTYDNISDGGLGSELTINGDFTTDTDWTKYSATISGGELTLNDVTQSYAFQDGSGVVIGDQYKYSYEVKSITTTGNGIRMRVGNTGYTDIENTVGVHTGEIISAGSTDRIMIEGLANFDGVVDDVSVKKINDDTIIDISGNGYNGTTTNMPDTSYMVNHTTKTTACTNCNSTEINLTKLSEGLNQLHLFLDTDTNNYNETINFTIDLTNPNIAVIAPIVNDFLVNFSEIVTYNDSLSGVDTCLLDAIYIENVTNASQYNAYNISCDSAYHFEAAGQYNGTFTVTDNAGNVETLSVIGTIQPFVYINFFDEDSNLLNNFNAILYHPDGDIVSYTNQSSPINLSPYHDDKGLDLGTYTITFDLAGYILSNHTFVLNETSGGEDINITIEEATINLKIYDYITNQLITDSVSISLIPTSYTDSITTGETNITGLTLNEGEYQIIATSSNYETETIFFTYDFQSYLEQKIYMIQTNETNLGVLVIEVEDSSSKIENQLVNLLAWSSNESAFITVGQSKTNSNGQAYFNVELDNTLYKATSTLNGQTETTAEQTIKVSGETIVITFNDVFESYPTKDDITYLLTNSSYNSTHQLVTFTFEDNDNIVQNFCLEARKSIISSSAIINEQCVTTNSGEISFYVEINQSYKIIVQAIAYKDEGQIILDSIIYQSNGNLEYSLGNLAIFFVLASFVISIALGVTLQNVPLIGILTIINSWLMYSVFSSTLSYTVPLLITVIMIAMLYATFKKRF